MVVAILYESLILIALLFGGALGMVSAYSVVKKQGMLGDIMSHASLPGIIYFFLFTQSTNEYWLLMGGTMSALLSGLLFWYVQEKNILPRNGGLALILGLFFNSGILGSAIIQKKSMQGQSMLNNFLFGNFITAAVNFSTLFLLMTIGILCFFLLTIPLQRMSAFDQEYSKLTISYYFFSFLLLVASVLTIVIGLQTVGILLIGSLIITPGTIAKIYAKSYGQLILISMGITITAFFIGIGGAYFFPAIPSGPLIALFPLLFCILSVIIKK